jgi:PAS domain S-box-containing protein
MNIKDSSSSIKNKIFLGFWFVVFAALILMVNWLFRVPVNHADIIINQLEHIEKQIAHLTSLHARFLVSYDRQDNLLANTDEAFESETDTIVKNINERITTIQQYHFAKRKEFREALDNFSTQANTFGQNLNNLILIIRERGNKSTGLVSRWMAISRQLLETPEMNNDQLRQNLMEIKNLENAYLLSHDQKVLEDISLRIEEIRNNVMTEETVLNLNDLDAYTILTGNLLALQKRMGQNSNKGIIPEIESSLQSMPASFASLQQMAVSHLKFTARLWTYVRYLMVIVIIGLFIYLFVNVFSLIDPLRQIAGFTSRMAEGEFPQQSIAVGKLIDMVYIKEALDKHIASLKDKLHFIRDLNKDDFSTSLKIAGENDQIGQELVMLQQKIISAIEKQAQSEEDNKVRRYQNEGLAKFADLLRSKNNDMQALGDAFIREAVKYLNAIQGGLFLYDETDKSAPVLRLTAAFAYNRKKYLEQTIAYGEGLVGTCAREKQYINLTEIPKGYITITSGLGDTPPNNLLLVPVLHENELLGVIEIASLNNFKDYEIEFTRQVAFSLGSTLVNTRNNQRTADLLTKSQQQALEMAEQEEEMRQNMEELKATQEESGRREEQYRGVAEAITSALMVIEYGIDGRINEVNEKVCLFLGKLREELIGKTHLEVFNGSLNPDTSFWNDLQHEGSMQITEKVRIGKKSFELIQHFVPVLNRNGITIKYINFTTDGRTGNS